MSTHTAKRRPYTLMERRPIPDDQQMGRAYGRDASQQRWHILDDDGAPLCSRRQHWEIVDLEPYSVVAGGRICSPCHGQFSWSPMPHDVERVDRGYETPCLVWTRGQSARGYGKREHAGQNRPTHIDAWEAANGPVPAGHVLHHDCEQKDCLEPSHMRPVTRAEHVAIHRRTFDYGEAARLHGLGWARKQIAESLGVSDRAVKAAFERMRKRGEL
jgi:hypothetical protein